jgi:hypothetical protein
VLEGLVEGGQHHEGVGDGQVHQDGQIHVSVGRAEVRLAIQVEAVCEMD